MRARSGKLVALLAVSLALAGCLNEEDKEESGSGLKEALNNPPVLAGVPPTSAMAGEPYGFQPAAADPDGQAITFSIRNKPRWAAFDEGTGRLSGTPTMDDLGSYPGVAIAASDGIATSELEEFAITVKAPPGAGGSNTTPTIAGTPPALAYVGTEYRFTPAAVDADGDALKFAVTGKPSWLSFDEASGTLSGTPGTEHLGVHEQIDGKFYVGAAPIAGRISGAVLTGLGDIVEKYAAQGVRFTSYQKLVVLGIDAADLESVIADLDAIGLAARPSNWRRNTMACTGIEF